jgi:hypothetical protein
VNKFTSTPTQSVTVRTIDDVIEALNAHTSDSSNPHSVTGPQLGLTAVLTWKGMVNAVADLPASPSIGWTYYVKDGESTSADGTVYTWDGTEWDNMGGLLLGVVRTINGTPADGTGNVDVAGGGSIPTPGTDTFFKGTGDFSNEISEIKVSTISAQATNIKVSAPLLAKLATANNTLTVDNTTSVYYVVPTTSLTIDISGCTYTTDYSRLVRVYVDLRSVSSKINVTLINGVWDLMQSSIDLTSGNVYVITIELLGNGKAYLGMPIGGGSSSGSAEAISDNTINYLFTDLK